MDEHDTVVGQGLVNEGASRREVDEQVGVVHVLDWDA